jgi:hypothetical protein
MAAMAAMAVMASGVISTGSKRLVCLEECGDLVMFPVSVGLTMLNHVELQKLNMVEPCFLSTKFKMNQYDQNII